MTQTSSNIIKNHIDQINQSNTLQYNNSIIDQQKQTHLLNQQPYTSQTKYRSDIDGLKGIAIILVIIYNAFPHFLPGGIIGSDIFFVISGYFITQTIISKIQKQQFSITKFYVRRINKILLPLWLVLVFTLLVVSHWSEKDQIKITLNNVNSSLRLSSNFQLMNNKQEFFNINQRNNPLLHLWSLSIQQQFYLVWPFVLLMIIKLFKNKLLIALEIIAGLSFAFSIIMIYINPNYSFYFPLCRLWQMTFGAILAYLNFNSQSFKINSHISTLAIIAILINAFMMNDMNLFPGFWALIPVFGTACIIQTQNQSFISKHILSSKPLVFIGQISYSLYLWHWPLLVLSRTFYPKGSTSILSHTLIILILALALITYFIIENPIKKFKFKYQQIAAIVIIFMLIGVGLLSWSIHFQHFQRASHNKKQLINQLQLAQIQMMPRGQDYFVIDGKKHPNLSKSKNRLKSTTSNKTRTSINDVSYDKLYFGKQKIFNQINKTSKYYRQQMQAFQYYSVLNQKNGNKLILMIGDSHAMKLSYRFTQLYKQSILKNQQFPTIVAMLRFGMFDDYQQDKFTRKVVFQFINKYRPYKVFIAKHWLNRWCYDLQFPLQRQANCNYDNVDKDVQMTKQFITTIKSYGIKVSILSIDVHFINLDPSNMINPDYSIKPQAINSFRLSSFRYKYMRVIQKYERGLMSLADIIDLSYNLCWQDNCCVLSPLGHGIYVDMHNYGKFYVRHWMSVLDRVVQQ